MFLVAGGYDGSGIDISSTETLVEGDQAWNLRNLLPSKRRGLRGISLPDTVIMTGNKNWEQLEQDLKHAFSNGLV